MKRHRPWVYRMDKRPTESVPRLLGERPLNNLVYIGFGLLTFGFVFFLYLVLSAKPEQDDEAEIE